MSLEFSLPILVLEIVLVIGIGIERYAYSIDTVSQPYRSKEKAGPEAGACSQNADTPYIRLSVRPAGSEYQFRRYAA